MNPDDLYPRFQPEQPNQCEGQIGLLEERADRFRSGKWNDEEAPLGAEILAAWDELPHGRTVMLVPFGLTFSRSQLHPDLFLFGQMDEFAYQEVRYLQATTIPAIQQLQQDTLDLHRNDVVWLDDYNPRSMDNFPRLYQAMLWKEEMLQKGSPFVHPPVPSDIAEMVYTRYRERQEREFVHDPATIAVELDPVTEYHPTLFAFWGTLPVRYRVRYQCVAPWVEEWCRLREDLITAADAGAAHAVAEQCIAQLHAYREQVAQWQLVSTREVGLFQMLGRLAQWRAAQLG